MSALTLHRLARGATRLERAARPVAWRALHPGIAVGARVRVGRGCRLFLDPHAELVLGDGCTVDDGATLAVYGHGRIELGPGSFLGHHCTLAAHERILIGPGTYLGELVSIRDHDHAVGYDPSSGRVAVDPVVIGAGSWIGAKATVIRGASIGDGVVVGANAVVRGDVPARSLCAGVPARVVRTYDSEEAQPAHALRRGRRRDS
jgi:acetyltransferase-like isoleucine patch superfamily enzyme